MGGGLIVGTVTDNTLTPIPGALVALVRASQVCWVVAEDTTDADGEYSMADLLPGPFGVIAGKTGFSTETADSVMMCWWTTRVDFQLEPFDIGWEYYGRRVCGTLSVWGTIDCVPQGDTLFSDYVYKWNAYRGPIPDWANDYLVEFRWDAGCGNIDRFKVAVPSYREHRGHLDLLPHWDLLPLAPWLEDQLTEPLVLPSIGDSTGSIQYVYVLVNPAEWLADPRPLQDTYTVTDGRCDDLPGYLIGTTPFVFDSLAGPDENPFSTTPLTGTLVLDADVTLSSSGLPSGCAYLPGDANGNDMANGIDVSYMVNYLKGFGLPPPDTCDCPPHGVIYSAADANGSCGFNGIDVSYMVNYLKGFGPPPMPCSDCPPAAR